MGQVPQVKSQGSESIYGIVGDGQVAKHMSHYLSLKKIPFKNWSRRSSVSGKITANESLEESLKNCNVIFLLISDSAIESFIRENIFFKTKTNAHFSGALVTELALGFHPLMTFGPDLYDLNTYTGIPFVGETGKPTLAQVIPELENPYFSIHSSEKAFYHSLCVMSGNFTTLLWQKFFSELENRLLLPKALAFPYMNQIVLNLQKSSWQKSVTGPLMRKDFVTVKKNREALEGDSFSGIYDAFVKTFFKEFYERT